MREGGLGKTHPTLEVRLNCWCLLEQGRPGEEEASAPQQVSPFSVVSPTSRLPKGSGLLCGPSRRFEWTCSVCLASSRFSVLVPFPRKHPGCDPISADTPACTLTVPTQAHWCALTPIHRCALAHNHSTHTCTCTTHPLTRMHTLITIPSHSHTYTCMWSHTHTLSSTYTHEHNTHTHTHNLPSPTFPHLSHFQTSLGWGPELLLKSMRCQSMGLPFPGLLMTVSLGG